MIYTVVMDKKYPVQFGVSVGAAFVVGFLWFTGLLNINGWLSLVVVYGFIWFALYLAHAVGAPAPKSR